MVDGVSNGSRNGANGAHGHPSANNGAPMWLALDAMGSDHGPAMTVSGALNGIREHGVSVILVGDEKLLHAEVQKQGAQGLLGSRLRVQHASDAVGMDEKVAQVVRRKDTSMRVAMELVKKGEARAVVSAGNSGAYMGTALLAFGRIKGVMRPAIGTLLPNPHVGTQTLLLDSGANTVVAPGYLTQWAFIGDAYARILQKKQRPSVAVLSNGEEDTKGTDVTRPANALLRKSPGSLNYVGYCEGRDIMTATVDVVITDGFTGNVVLKTVEGVGKAIKDGMEARFRRSVVSKLQYLAVANLLGELRAALDYRLTGGAPLLGVNGVAIVAHGKSDEIALGHALRVARTHVELNLNESITRAIAEHDALFPDAKENARRFTEKSDKSDAPAGAEKQAQ